MWFGNQYVILMSLKCFNAQESTNQTKKNEYNGETLTLLSTMDTHSNNKTINHERVKYIMGANSSFIKLMNPYKFNREFDPWHPLRSITKLI